ncbi:L-seryl-tRNA(Sec) selenium transferase [Falsiroseomonas tokyonensis]|uniref:L-seryl-tRNA(Sec) selenium transferase n=1 Tax=Falsiroseomonas tokyonensis TaxID=430521 RepID=A0ABV7BPE1_9PROT|nr:L-seryl-tRNA(Sec) selenium transferase [Falsiroseomonas tokyonensis]MBU8536704.1 L-seryl-tRNA(Sec) selenium transferase [Falsiroseomonas tokyonensis]
MDASLRRALPALHRLLETPEAAELLQQHPRAAVVAALRAELAGLRAQALPFETARSFAAARAALAAAARPGLRQVINATGVVLHTNLGRAPLPQAARDAVAAEAAGYCNLELDLETGRRGHRHAACAALLAELTGAEAALVVNNGAAAMLLALSALAAGGEAVVSRGELVEIGGGFRIPDVIRQGGARLVEVGATNRTRLADYANAIGPETRLLLRVHQSNFLQMGFTAMVEPAALVTLAREGGLLSVVDLGSGALVDLSAHGLPAEPTMGQAVGQGFDLVVASGDKLLGGPQAGLLLGRAAVVERLATHPLMRALRCDKLTLAALEATLRLYRDPAGLREAVPALAMLSATAEEVGARAARLLALLPEGLAEMAEGTSLVGGGSLPAAARYAPAAPASPPGNDRRAAGSAHAPRRPAPGRARRRY